MYDEKQTGTEPRDDAANVSEVIDVRSQPDEHVYHEAHYELKGCAAWSLDLKAVVVFEERRELAFALERKSEHRVGV